MVAATAAPAFAGSPGGLSVVDGETGIGFREPGWRGVTFDGFVIQSTTALAADELTVTLSASTPSQDVFFTHDDYLNDEYVAAPAPWSAPIPTADLRSVSFTYSEPVAANEPVHLVGLWALAANENMTPLSGFALNVVVSAGDATSVARTFSEPLIVNRGSTQIADATQAVGNIGVLFDGFLIQSTTALEPGALTVDLHGNNAFLKYQPGTLHDWPGPQWSAVVRDPLPSGVVGGVVFTNSTPVEANVPIQLEGLLALVTDEHGNPSENAREVRVGVWAPDTERVSRSFAYRA